MKKTLKLLGLLLLILILGIVLYYANLYNLLPKRSYTADDFNIQTLKSTIDFNQNGVDDYADFVLGARKDAMNHPTYDGSYVEGGYPSDDVGVCSDVVWRAFKQAGYNLKDMIDQDIKLYHEEYPNVTVIDPNIDFRRVKNLHVFFKKYAIELTTDIHEIEQWQPGDIVIFGNDTHIGIVSDKRNNKGQVYIIHNGGQPNREEDYLKRGVVTSHYRFDASKIKHEIIKKW